MSEKTQKEDLMPPELPVIKGIYRHYRGADYVVLNVARHHESGDYLVVYCELPPGKGLAKWTDSPWWVRPLNSTADDPDGWNTPGPNGVTRFTLTGIPV